MIGVVAVLRVRDGQALALEQAMTEVTAKVKADEPGNRMYQLTRSRTEPRTYKVLEMYVDDAALEAHRSSDHYRALGAKLADVLERPAEVEVLDALD